jgi:alpha-beta hydrolase superfamily lysophospholipase
MLTNIAGACEDLAMQHTTFTFDGAGGLPIFTRSWRPDDEASGVVVVAHGMGEHSARYARFAAALVDHGWWVVAPDHRGHGHTAPDASHYGDFGEPGWEGLVDDLLALGARLDAESGGLTRVLFGHSMGSFAAQRVILDHADTIDAAVLCGTTALDVLAGVVTEGAGADLTAFNAFEPARTDFDWLSRDDAEVDKYIDDPMCGFGVNAAAMTSMAKHAPRHADPDALDAIRDDLPILLIAGSADPINAGLALVELVAQRYRDAGVVDVTTKWYTDARHEILNEINRDDVTADVIAWLDRVTSR